MFNPVLLIAIPLLIAFISILGKKIAPFLLLLVSLFNIVYLFFVDFGTHYIGGFTAPYGISLVLDKYSFFGLLVVNILFLLILVVNYHKVVKMATPLIIALAGLNGLLLTGDLFNLFVFIEISGIAAYIITSTNKKPLATFHYLVIGTVGSGLYLLGLILLYSITGTLNMNEMAVRLADVNAVNVILPFTLMFIGLGVEAKLLPFNSWVKGILENANSLVGQLISSTYAAAILLLIGRLLTDVFVIADNLLLVFTILATLSLIAGEIAAFRANKLREMLLFSSVAQSGLVILLILNGVMSWAMLLIAANAVSKFILFGISAHIAHETGSDSFESVKGLFSNNKVLGIAYTVAALSVSGLPLFVGFIIKFNFLTNLFMLNQAWLVAVILITSVIEGAYFVKSIITLWYSKEETNYVLKNNFFMKYITFILALLLIVFGVYYTPATDYSQDAINDLNNNEIVNVFERGIY